MASSPATWGRCSSGERSIPEGRGSSLQQKLCTEEILFPPSSCQRGMAAAGLLWAAGWRVCRRARQQPLLRLQGVCGCSGCMHAHAGC